MSNVVFDKLMKSAIIQLCVLTSVSRSQWNWYLESVILKKVWVWN